jgi:cobaltochelatase CobN
MHRPATLPGDGSGEDTAAFIEQPQAPVVLLSSADTDLAALADLLDREPALLGHGLRALNLAALAHPAVIDHYVSSSLGATRLLVVRLLGGRGHWSYGLERLRAWAADSGAQLLVLAGTADEERALACLGTVPEALAIALAGCLREGGDANLRLLLGAMAALLAGETPEPPQSLPAPDPLPHDWREEAGPRVGLIAYRAQWQAGDLLLLEAAAQALRQAGLCPRPLWVSSLRDPAVQSGVADLLGAERVDAVICATGFASVQFEEAGLGAPLWEKLGVPVLQLISSGQSRRAWQQSSIGLGPLDLSMQVALPELDGRITTRIGALKEPGASSVELATALTRQVPDPERLAWIAALTAAWIGLRRSPASERRLALVLANYPTRNSRLANGVGLDTPASAVLMLRWLAEAGYGLGEGLPADGDALIHQLLAGRSNDPESGHRKPLDHLPLADYLDWYGELPLEPRRLLEARWGTPDGDEGLEAHGFPIHGLRFGRVVVLIQPERGYGRDPALNYHSPDLPPTHAYLAQYLWLRRRFRSQVVVHVG